MPSSLSTADLREAYLAFFESKGCVRRPSAPLVNADDPTTLFTVAGMAQFKNLFLGRGEAPFTRATTCQKCMRTNDILQVGRTPRHHTFFEMLGNFSFNDYFKEETIHWAWEFLTERLGLPADRLWVTTHRLDTAARAIWRDSVGVPEARMQELGDGDNFWPADAPTAGPLGPGGCCSEIFWDFRPEDGETSSPGQDPNNRFVEIWNLVFPQFNVTEPRGTDGRYRLEDLGRRNIDTGAGLERLACVLQGERNNFDIDLFRQLISRVCAVTGGRYAPQAEPEAAVAIRRIADHVRGVTFAIADQARPDSKGAGYVVRRLIRRAVLDADKLGLHEPGLYKLVDAVVATMGGAYPELKAVAREAANLLGREEEQFRKTLRRGMNLLGRELDAHRARGATIFDGKTAFHLYETDGFPREITEEILADAGLHIDSEGWLRASLAHEEVSRSKTAQVFEASDLLDAKAELGRTNFVGYNHLSAPATVRFIEVDGRAVDEAREGQRVRFVLDQSPFYAESGGQVGDRGVVENDACTLRVEDVQKDGGVWIHSGLVEVGVLRRGRVRATVDAAARSATAQHHSATHLLHSALHHYLGEHVAQQGSKVEPGALRFDFNNEQAVDEAQLAQIEAWVNDRIAESHPVQITEMSIDEAKAKGAKALFGEKYGAVVRVVDIGGPEVSIELCGGCHVTSTSDIGRFRIVKEEASSAGVRRISAIAGPVAEALTAREQQIAAACAQHLDLPIADAAAVPGLAKLLKAPSEELPARVEALAREAGELRSALQAPLPELRGDLLERVVGLQRELRDLQKRAGEAASREAGAAVLQLAEEAAAPGGVCLIAAELPVDGKGLRAALDTLKGSGREYACVLAAAAGDKAVVAVGLSRAAQASGLHAGELIAALAPLVGGKGGGKPEQAQGGGPDAAGIPSLLAEARRLLAAQLEGVA